MRWKNAGVLLILALLLMHLPVLRLHAETDEETGDTSEDILIVDTSLTEEADNGVSETDGQEAVLEEETAETGENDDIPDENEEEGQIENDALISEQSTGDPESDNDQETINREEVKAENDDTEDDSVYEETEEEYEPYHSYTASYKTWSQGASDYVSVREAGCAIVALSKMLVESGVETSPSFNPDVFALWEQENKFISKIGKAGDYDILQKDWNAASVYAGNKGKTLTYLGAKGAAVTDLWTYVNAGYFVIVHTVKTIGDSQYHHFVMIDNETTKANGTLYCYDSYDDSAASGSVNFEKYISIADKAHVYAGNPVYGSDYWTWQQFESKITEVKQRGSLIIAMAKMIYEAGIDRDAGFDPDVLYNSFLNDGYINSNTAEISLNNWEAPGMYAAKVKKELVCESIIMQPSLQEVWENVHAGKYTIIDTGGHYVMVDNLNTLTQGDLFIYDSNSTVSYEYSRSFANNSKPYSLENAIMYTYYSAYGTGYWTWQQFQSQKTEIKQHGSLMIAIAKMICEAKINQTSTFDPDVLYDTFLDDGYISSSTTEISLNNWSAPGIYASKFGKQLAYEGKTANPSLQQVWENVHAGKYTIIDTGGHYVMVDNSNTLAQGDLFIYESHKTPSPEHSRSFANNLKPYSLENSTIYTYNASGVSVTGVSLNITSKTLNSKGAAFTLIPTVSPSGATNKTVTWSSSDPGVATVSSNGAVTAVSSGTAVITVKTADGGYTAKCTVTVNIPTITGITLQETAITIKALDNKVISITTQPADSTDDLDWVVSASSIAYLSKVDGEPEMTTTVSGESLIHQGSFRKALLRARKPGETNIIIKNTAGSELGRMQVTVLAREEFDYLDSLGYYVMFKDDGYSINTDFTGLYLYESKLYYMTAGKQDKTVNGQYEYQGVTYTVVNGAAEYKIPVSEITLDRSVIDLTVGGSADITAAVVPENATNKNLEWTSGNTAVATVDENGKVTAVGEGTAVITAKALDGTDVTAACTVTVIGQTVTGEKTAVISGGNASAAVSSGTQIRVPVELTKNPGFISGSVQIEFDSTVFELKEIDYSGIVPDYSSAPITDAVNGTYLIQFGDDTYTQNVSETGTLFTMVFTVRENAAEGDHTITLSAPEGMWVDFEGRTVETAVVNSATITLEDMIIGDVDGDGKVNATDRLLLVRYLAKWNGYEERIVNMKAADIDRNGTVNASDRVILVRYLAKWGGIYDSYFN